MNKKKENILKTATYLFNSRGFTAIGVDRIIQEAHVSKMTFYKHFPAKEILVKKCLEIEVERRQSEILEKTNKNLSPLKNLKIIYKWYYDWITRDEFKSCLIKKASIEIINSYPSIQPIINQHYKWLEQIISSNLLKLGVKQITDLTFFFLIMIDGLIIGKQLQSPNINFDKTWSYIEHIISFENMVQS